MSAIAVEPPSAAPGDARPVARRRGRPTVLVAVASVVFLVFVVFTLAGSLITPFDPREQDLVASALPPGGGHLLGTDELGRDVLSRIIAGTRSTLLGGLLIAVGTTLLGGSLGIAAGFLGGRVETMIMRWADLMYSVPYLLATLVLVGTLGGSLPVAVAVLIVLGAPYDARLIRSATLTVRGLPYVEAARVMGLPRRRIMLTEIWPNVSAVASAAVFLNFAYASAALASLSFLGVGIPPETPSWGRLLFEGKSLIYDNPAMAVAPAVCFILLVGSINVLGDSLYERLTARGRAR